MSLAGPTLVFGLNAVSFIGIVAVLLWWRRPPVEQNYPPERALAALSAGGRFIRSSPIVRRILLRTALFIAPASALWGLQDASLGSVVWGVLAGATTSVTSLLVSVGLLLACGLSSLWWPLHANTGNLDLTPSSHWPEPALVFEPEPLDGPVLVLTSYRVRPENEERFIAAMAVLGRSRQRTGAAQWRLFRSVEEESTFVETFVVRSWGEHMHQHYTRLTSQDQVIEANVDELVEGEAISHHYLAVRDAG